MRRVLVVAVAVVLQGCISVEDFGDSWSRGVVDPDLAGRWQKVGLPGVDPREIAGAETMTFTAAGGQYTIVDTPAGEPVPYATTARTLRAGTGRLLLVRFEMPEPLSTPDIIKGHIFRYEVTGNRLMIFWANPENFAEQVRTKYPSAGIRRVDGPLLLERFGETTHALLAETAGDDAYWFPWCEYRKGP